MCSSHTTSSKKHRKLRLSVLFCCKNAENGVGQNVSQLPDPHRDPHAEMHGKGERALERKLLPFRCSACLRDLSNLCHEAAHFLRGLLLHLPRGVSVGSQGESHVAVTQHAAGEDGVVDFAAYCYTAFIPLPHCKDGSSQCTDRGCCQPVRGFKNGGEQQCAVPRL